MIQLDYQKPDYRAIYADRVAKLRAIRSQPGAADMLREYYKDNPADFIGDWGCTYDPRNIEVGLPAVIPFVPFPKQVELINWFTERWRAREPGVMPKSRDMGASWCFIAWCLTMGLHHEGFAAGIGSRKEAYVDKGSDPKSLLWKGRMFLEMLPPEFRGGWTRRDAPHMRITIPATGAVLTGEAGDGIGRGDRTSVYGVDESAHLERPDLVDAALSQTTNCRIDMSSVNGTGNPFARKCLSWPPERVFRMHWRDDPRKSEEWYEAQKVKIDNPLIVAQEIDIDFNASTKNVLIPSDWVQAAVGAHTKLGIAVTGDRRGALDVADEGDDKNAHAGRHGILLRNLETWSGQGSDLFDTTQMAFSLSELWGYDNFSYDADGLGAGVRGDARVINGNRRTLRLAQFRVTPYRGSESVVDPKGQVMNGYGEPMGRTNEDYFANRKAQSWWALRHRFQCTWRALNGKGGEVDNSELISIDPDLPELQALIAELSQPTFSIDGAGKVLVNKKPPGTKSPNRADAVVILYAPNSAGYDLTEVI